MGQLENTESGNGNGNGNGNENGNGKLGTIVIKVVTDYSVL